MVRVWEYSDNHFESSNMCPPSIPDHDVCIIAGDLDRGEEAVQSLVAGRYAATKPTIYVAGNHEFYSGWETIEARERKMAYIARKNPLVHFLNPGVVEIAGVRFIGATLWTDFELFGAETQADAMRAAAAGMNDFRLIPTATADGKGVRKFAPGDALARHRSDLDFIVRTLEVPFDGPTVVVTHHGPSMRSVPEEFDEDILSAAFSSRLDWVIERYQPALWIHGHTHNSMDYTIGSTRVICNPQGYQHSPNPEFRWNLVIDIETPDCEPTKGFGL
jgi:hypothetical protein